MDQFTFSLDDVLTSYCGTKFRSSDSKGDIKSDFIDKYSIDMSQYSPSDYTQYESANAWFIRGVQYNTRVLLSCSLGLAILINVPAWLASGFGRLSSC